MINKLLIAGALVGALSIAACNKPAASTDTTNAAAAAPADNSMAPANTMAPADNSMAPSNAAS